VVVGTVATGASITRSTSFQTDTVVLEALAFLAIAMIILFQFLKLLFLDYQLWKYLLRQLNDALFDFFHYFFSTLGVFSRRFCLFIFVSFTFDYRLELSRFEIDLLWL
jgi:hypothetical protein